MSDYLTREDYIRCSTPGGGLDSKFCRLCDGALQVLGTLGGLVHYRCRGCGVEYSGEAIETVRDTAPPAAE